MKEYGDRVKVKEMIGTYYIIYIEIEEHYIWFGKSMIAFNLHSVDSR